jgi:hypothetical protein
MNQGQRVKVLDIMLKFADNLLDGRGLPQSLRLRLVIKVCHFDSRLGREIAWTDRLLRRRDFDFMGNGSKAPAANINDAFSFVTDSMSSKWMG